MVIFYRISLLVVLLCATSKLSSQTYKVDFDFDYISGISSHVYSGNLVAVNDSVALLNLGRAIICKTNFKTGRFLDTLDNKLVYDKIKEKINSTELYKDVEFFDASNKDEILTCNHYYFQFRRIIRLNTNKYVSEIAVSTADHNVLFVLLYLNQNLDIEQVKVLEETYSSYGVSYMSMGGYFEYNDEIFIRSGLVDASIYDKNTASYFSRFKSAGDYYKFSGFIDGVEHGKRNLYTLRFHTFFYNDDRLCTTNGWEIFCFSDDLEKCELNLDLEIPSDKVYSTIREIGDDRYIAVKMNLSNIGSAIGDCDVVLLDENFKEYENVIQFYIQRFSILSLDYLNGTAYLYFKDIKKKELFLLTLKVDRTRER